jgi:Spy/CpxP family protein refolding chaperone
MNTGFKKAVRCFLLMALIPAGGVATADTDGHRGYGHGMGMQGMGMHGPGMMGMGMMGPMQMLDLSDAQREKINKIADDKRKKTWQLMGQRMDEQAKLRDLYAADPLDAARILAVYDRMHRIKREMIEVRIKAHNEKMAVLTKEQREQLKNWRRGMPMGPGGPRGGMTGPGMMGPGMMGH